MVESAGVFTATKPQCQWNSYYFFRLQSSDISHILDNVSLLYKDRIFEDQRKTNHSENYI